VVPPYSPSGSTTANEERKKLVLLILPSAAVMVALLLMPLHLQRFIFPPPGKIVSGPLYGGALFMLPPFVAFVYIICAGCIAQLRNRSRKRFPASALPIWGMSDWLTLIVLVCAAAIYTYGISAYWFVTPNGLTVQSSWFAQPKSYLWVDVTQRQIACFLSRGGGGNATFRLELQDGQEIDIADTQQAEFAKHFAQLAMLTHAAPVVVNDIGDGRYCPSVILNFLAEHRP
jgi:hypothetical protein